MSEDLYISVDVETAGPIPGEYSMLSLGACVVGRPEDSFYTEFAPISENFIPEALAISGLDLAALKATGLKPQHAMKNLHEWIDKVAEGKKPVFVGFNAPFDWSFVNYYFHRFHGSNPFGFSSLDVKALFMGATGCSWDETKASRIRKFFGVGEDLTHQAKDDAVAQADLFERTLALVRKKV